MRRIVGSESCESENKLQDVYIWGTDANAVLLDWPHNADYLTVILVATCGDTWCASQWGVSGCSMSVDLPRGYPTLC